MLRTTSARRWGAVVVLALSLSLAAVPAADAAPAWTVATQGATSWLGRLWTALERLWEGAAAGVVEVAAKDGSSMDPLG